MDATLAILVRWALFADLMLLFGVPLFALCTTPGAGGARLRAVVLATTSIGILLSALGISSVAAIMSGTGLGDLNLASVNMVITATAVGTAFLVRVAALAAAFASALLVRGDTMIAGFGAMLGAVALASLAWSGHGVMDDGGTGAIHLVADITHLLAAGIWIGALAALLWRLLMVNRDGASGAHKALAGFAKLGTVSVALILVSGLANSWLLVGPDKLLSLGSSLYGRLLLIKLALFAAMLALAALNRFRLTPALGAAVTRSDIEAATLGLRFSLTLETLCAVAILGLVAWLGTLAPPVSNN